MTDAAELAGLLAAWMPQRRWYASKNSVPRIESVVVSPAGGGRARRLAEAGLEILEVFVTDCASGSPVVYQVPLVRRRSLPDDAGSPDSGTSPGVVGRDREGRWLVDAASEPEYLRWLLPEHAIGEARVLDGEQSNTSVICECPEGPHDLIVKIFRVVDAGSNPDVELQDALTREGIAHVPKLAASGWGGWSRGSATEYGHLWVANEFLEGAQDAWRVATAAVAAGEDLDAAGLGRAVAEVH
ncbi:MAG: 1,4-alpha-glucan branching enzyme, partial [bacterium]|nr:1,4-alpha-glucan branching enzyme [bacterium]